MKEEEIRPQDIFDEYLRLCEIDSREYFSQASAIKIPCPACGANGAHSFEKKGFSYEVCPDCDTLFASPRPPFEAFMSYYRDSPSTRYWAEVFYPVTAEARKEKLWKPKAHLIKDFLNSFPAREVILDIGGGFGVFAEVATEIIKVPVAVIEPSVHLAQSCREKGFEVIEKPLEEVCISEVPQGPRCFVSFELFEHLHDPRRFLKSLHGLMEPGDCLVMTTLSAAGLDILVLWERAKAVFPPHHLNFFTPDSIRGLMREIGFVQVDVQTPGKLDLSILQNHLHEIEDRFWSFYLSRASEQSLDRMQEILVQEKMSSHMMIFGAKE
jgi:hypothetical protein